MPLTSPNIFQRLVLGWEQLHPYNGVQVARVALRPAGGEILERSWADTLECLGIGSMKREGRGYAWGPLPQGASRVAWVEGVSLDAHLSAEMNRPFDDADSPLRAFALPAGPGELWVGLAYRHWLADSVAVRRVLREWITRAATGHGTGQPPLRLPAPGEGYWHLLGPSGLGGPLPWGLGSATLDSARQSSRMKRVMRVEGTAGDDFAVAFSRHPTPPGTLARCLHAARSRGARVNDLLLAALAVATAAHGPLERTARRQDMALGTIVDLRPAARSEAHPSAHADLTDVFGLYLGFTTAFLRPRQYASLDDSIHGIATQHRLARTRHSAAASMLRMAAGVCTHRLLRDRRKLTTFYRKRLPLSGGISNVNLDRDPLAALHPEFLREVVRVSPTGPMMPAVLSATTLGGELTLGFTRRSGLVPDDMARAIIGEVVTVLATL